MFLGFLKEGNIIVLRTRMMPFKTKVVYDYKINWGYKREPAQYPQRDKKDIALFDLKGFVDVKRDAKINDMMNSFGGAPTENKMSRPFENPFGSSQPTANDFNIDDIVKKIDAKIAELEEQERLEKEAENVAMSKVTSKSEVTDDQFFDDFFNDED